MSKSAESNLTLSLAKQLQDLGGTDAHFRANNMKSTQGLTGVISVYDNIKPSYMVLEELEEWSEQNNPEVFELIQKLKEDMSWNDENPV